MTLLAALGGSPVVGAAILLIVAALGAAMVRLALTWGSQRFVMATGHDMAAAVFGRMLRQPYAEQVRRNSSQTLAAVEKVQGVVFGLLQPAMQGLIGAFIALCVFALLLRIDARAAGLAAFSVALVYVGVSLLVRPRLRRNSEALAGTMVERTRTVQEGLGGIRDIILDRSEPLFEAKFRELDSRYRRAQAATQFVAGAPRFVVEAAGLVAIALVTLAMSLEPGGVVKAIPVLGALALGAQRLLPLLQQAYYGWSLASGNFRAFRDVIDMMEAPIPPPQPEAPPLAFERELAFDRVGFRYPEGRFALVDVSFRIRAGEHVGIAGATGGGKSTLLDLLMGLLEPDEGAILRRRPPARRREPSRLAGRPRPRSPGHLPRRRHHRRQHRLSRAAPGTWTRSGSQRRCARPSSRPSSPACPRGSTPMSASAASASPAASASASASPGPSTAGRACSSSTRRRARSTRRRSGRCWRRCTACART